MPSKPTPSSSSHPPLGALIDDGSLELVEVLGVGGYGIVYRAEETFTASPKSYAVKCLTPYGQSSRQRQIHIREISLHQIAGAHPNVASLYRVVEDHRHIYIIMEYAPDHDLFSQILHSCRYLGQDHLIRHVFLQLLDAVEYCHSLGIYHRDLKPENVLCFEDGLRVAITDFGLATTDKVSAEFRTGSVYHMSPECQGGEFALSGTYSPMANDVWSLGIILLNLATGRNPWKSATITDPTFQAYLRDPDHFLPSVLPISEEINAVLVRMLEVDWTRRLSLAELRLAMEDVTTFYSEDAVFEGSMARCSWEAEMEIDCEPEMSASLPPTKEVEPQSRWSSDTDSDIIFASPSTAVESSYGQLLAQEGASCMWSADSSSTRSSLFVRPHTPDSSHSSLASPSTSGSGGYSLPPTPNSQDTTFCDKARISDLAPSRHPLTINTNLSPDAYYGQNHSMKSYDSSFMQTAVEYDRYDDSFYFPSPQDNSKLSPAMPESVILNPSYASDKDMSSPSLYSAETMSRYSSTRSYYEVAEEGRVGRSSTEIHVHPQRISFATSSGSSEDSDFTPQMSFSCPKQFKLLSNRTKKILDIFPRSRTPSPSPPPRPHIASRDSSLPGALSFTFPHTSTDSPVTGKWPDLSLPKPVTCSDRHAQTWGRTAYLRSRPWFLPGKLFT